MLPVAMNDGIDQNDNMNASMNIFALRKIDVSLMGSLGSHKF